MPRGRHRHSPPLHRVLPPSAIAGVSLVCAAGPWLFTEAFALRVLAAGAAVTAVAGAVVMRRWDSAAGKRVADLTRARASDEWRHEERVAELETDLDESRELRVKLEQKLRAKRTELAGLRNEHAALLRRYATAETERATALEGRRQLAIEASVPVRALPAARTAPDAAETTEPSGTPESPDTADVVDTVDSPDVNESVETSGEPDGSETSEDFGGSDGSAESGTFEKPGEPGGAVAVRGSGMDAIEAFTAPDDDTAPFDADADVDAGADSEASAEVGTGTGTGTGTGESPEVFSPAGSSLFLRAGAALSRITSGAEVRTISGSVALALPDRDPGADPGSVDVVADAGQEAEPATAESATGVPARGESALDAAVKRDAAAKRRAAMRKGAAAAKDALVTTEAVAAKDTVATNDAAVNREAPTGASATGTGPSADSVAEAGGAQGKPEAVGEHQRAAAEAHPSQPAASARTAPSPQAEAAQQARASQHAKPAQRTGHFTVPTAVAVVPHTAPVRPPSAEGGFDFFGTQTEESDAAAMEAVQNEDLADVVGQEALALHKAEAESGFKPASEDAGGADRQVIDLTAHDETEHINMTGLRTAAS
ncbi:hypothetical protein [Streptomyces sp. NBC_00728]|uniref:hypothetical protein n=1 Tax=Streptomyces sp. NBC_00728 TaxID=2903676 RepID=UPI0038653D0C